MKNSCNKQFCYYDKTDFTVNLYHIRHDMKMQYSNVGKSSLVSAGFSNWFMFGNLLHKLAIEVAIFA